MNNGISESYVIDGFYELTMMQGYYRINQMKQFVLMYFTDRIRLAADMHNLLQLEQMIDYINNLRFSKEIYNILEALEHLTVIFLIT